MHLRRFCIGIIGVGLVSLSSISSYAQTGSLRIVDWNIEDDINGATTPLPGLNTVLEGIGQESTVAGTTGRPLDIMALEETTSNATTVAPIVAYLNNDYGAGTYAITPYQATESGNSPSDGNGPNSLVYDTKTVTLNGVLGVGTPTGATNGEYRQVVRYEFTPVGGTTPFYIYDSHMKSGSTSADAVARGKEAAIIRTDEQSLPAHSSVIIMGDLNADPTEAGETQFTVFGNTATQGAVTDPYNYSLALSLLTESSTNLRYRDDYQLMTSDVINDTGAINYVTGSLHSFGNNGSSGKNVTSGSDGGGNNTDLAYMTTANGYAVTQTQILSALGTASDHLPNVADYTFAEAAIPEPASLALVGIGTAALVCRRRRFK